MSTRLPLFKIEAILHTYLRPYQCQCRQEPDSSLSVRLYGDPSQSEELTVLGISCEQCRDAANLVRLAQELRIEMHATRSSIATAPEPLGAVK